MFWWRAAMVWDARPARVRTGGLQVATSTWWPSLMLMVRGGGDREGEFVAEDGFEFRQPELRITV